MYRSRQMSSRLLSGKGWFLNVYEVFHFFFVLKSTEGWSQKLTLFQSRKDYRRLFLSSTCLHCLFFFFKC